MPTGRTWGALTKMDTTVQPGYAPPPLKRDYGTTRIGTTTTKISYVTSAAARKTTSRPSMEDDAPGGKFAKIEVRGQTTRKDTTPTLTATKTIRIGPPKNPGESGFIHQVDRADQDQVDTSAAVTMEISGQHESFIAQTGVAYGQVASLTPQAGQQEKIMVTVTDGNVTGAKQLKSGQTKELSPLETQQIMASVPAETAQQSGNIVVTVTEGKVVETRTVTEKEAETIVSLVIVEADPTIEKVVVSLEGGQVVGKRVGKDKATTLSPQEAAQLWRSVAQPGQQIGDVVVSLQQGQIVGSQQLTPTEAETIKAVVVEEPKPTVCVTPGQPAFTSIVPTTSQQVAPQEDKIMVTVTDGKVTGAKQLKSGQTKELSPLETQQIMASVPAESVQQSGNIMVTVTGGKVVDTKTVTEKETETIVSLVTEEADPTAEKVVVSVENGQVVGKRVGKDKATPLSPQEAAQLWRSVAQPGQQTGDVVVSLQQGQIVGSQQLTPTEAETIKSVVCQEAQAAQVIQTSPQVQPGDSVTLQQPGVVGAVWSGAQIEGTVVPGTVAPGMVALGTVAPGTVAPGTVLAPGKAAPGVASGTVPTGTVATGMTSVTTGIVTPGTVTAGPGSIVPGAVTGSESVSVGTVAPGGVAPASGTATVSGQIQEYLPPFARHPLPPISVGDTPAATGSEMPLSPSTTVMASIEGGNIVRARKLNFGKFEDFALQEAEQMLSGLPERQETQSGNIMVMISEGQIVKSQQLSPWVAEQLIATMSGSAPGQVTVPVSGQATYVPAPGSPPVTVPVFGQAKISPAIVEKPVTPVSGEAKFFTGQEPGVADGQGTLLQGTASQQIAGSSVITQQATVTVSGMTPGFQTAPIETTPVSTVPAHGFQPNIPQVNDETLPAVTSMPHVLPMIPETLPDTSERIVASFSDGKIVGAQKIVNGRTVQVEPAYAETALATAPNQLQAALQSGTIMMSVVDGKVQETKPLTPAEAQYVAATATVEDTGKTIPHTAPGLQQVGGSQTRQVLSSQVYNYQTSTPSLGQQALQPSEKIMMTIDEGKVVEAVQLKHGESTQIPASEAEKMLVLSGQPGQQSGNVMLTVSEGAVLNTQQVTPREAETIVTTLTAQPDPTAETIMVRFLNGQVVGAKKNFREQTSTLSAPEAKMLLSSVPNQPTPQTGNILLIKSEGRIVESQELTSTEADTIMTTVFKKAPQQPLAQQQPLFASVTHGQPEFTSMQTTQQRERIVVMLEDGKVTGAKDLKTGQQKQLSQLEAQQIMASAPAGTDRKTGNLMVTVKDGRVAESKPVTQTEAETIASVVAEQTDPTAEKVVVSVENGQVVGKRVGKDKATTLSPQEAAQLWRSVAQPGQQTGDVVVSLQQGQIVGSQQLTPTEAETIKAVVVEEPKPTEDKIMVTVTDGKVTGAKQLKSGQAKELSPLETQQIMASVPAEAAEKSGNIMVTVTEGKVVDTKTVTEREAETIVSLVTEEADPTAEKVVVSVENGQVVGKRVGKDKATPLSPQEAAQLWRSVAQPGQQTGDVVVSLQQGQIVGSQQLTPTEAETIKAVVVEEPKPTVCVTPGQPAFTSIVPTTSQQAAPQEDKIMVTVTDGKVTGAKQLKSGQAKELSPLETQQIMASVPAEAAEKSGNIMEAAQLWRSVAQPGQQTGDVVVSLQQGQIVGSQQLTPTEAETIKAVVVEEPKPTVCVTPGQPEFSSATSTLSTIVSTESTATDKPVISEKIIVNVANGKITGAKHLRPGDLKDLSPSESREISSYVPVQKPGNVVLTVADGKVIESKRVTEIEAENIISLVSEESAPGAEKAIVTLEGGKIVAQRVGKDKTTALSPQEAEELWRSVAHPGQISGDVMVSLSGSRIVGSQQLTPTEAETIKAVVTEKARPAVKISTARPLDWAPGQDIRGAETLMATIVDGKVVGARKLTDGLTTEVSTAEAEDIISSVPGQSSQTGHVLATLVEKEVVEVQQLTPKDAEEITVTGAVPRAIDTTPGEKVLLTVAAGRVAEAQKVGLRKLTPLSPTEGQKLLESASIKTKEPGDIAVTIVEGKVVGSRWVSSKLGSTQPDGAVPTGETAVIRKVVMTPSGERVVQEVVTPKDAPASEMSLAGDYGKRVQVEVLEGRAAMKEFLAGSSTDSDQEAYMTSLSSQSDAYVSASSDAYVTPPSEPSDAYVTPPGEPMDYSGAAGEQDGKSWFAQVTDKVTSAFFSPSREGDAVKVTDGTVPVESSIERSTSAEDIFVDAEQGRPVPETGMAVDVSGSTEAGRAPRPLQIGQVQETTVVPSVLPGREPTETDERQPKQRTVSEVARDVIPPVHIKTGELKTEPQFFGQSEVQEAKISPEHVGPNEPVRTRRTTSEYAEEIIGPLANSTSPQKGDVFFTEVPGKTQLPRDVQQKVAEDAARQKRTELEYFRHVSQESEDVDEMAPEALAALKEKAAEDDNKKSSRVSFRTGPPEVIGTTEEEDEDKRKPIATITMEKTEKIPIGDVKLAPAAKVAGKEPGKPTWNKVWPEKPESLPADVTTMETVEVEEYQLAPGVGRAGAVPAFTKKLSTMLAKEGSTFEAAVRVSGDPQPDITWYHQDRPLKPTDKLDIVKDKDYSSLVFMEVLPEHAGLYSCVATNIMGKATSRAPLVITDEMDTELPMPGAVMSDEGELEAEEDEAPALPPRLLDENDERALPTQLQRTVPAVRGRTDSSSVSSLEPDDTGADEKVREAKSAVVKELKEFQATSPTFKTPQFGLEAPEEGRRLKDGVTVVTPTVDGERVSPGKDETATPASKVTGVSVGGKAEVTTPKDGTQAEVTTPTGGVGIEAVRLPSGSAPPAPVKVEKKKSGLKKMFSGKKKKDKEAKKGTPSGKAGVTPVQAETKPVEGEDEVFSPGIDVKPGEGQKAPSAEETVLTISTTETKVSPPGGKARPGDLPVAIGEVVWAEPAKGATPKGRTPSAELRTPSTGGKSPSVELGSPVDASAEKKKTGWSKFKRTFSVKKKKDKKSSSSSSSIDRIPYEKRQAYASGSLPRSAEKYPELSRSTTMPVRPVSMVSPGERPDLSRASLRTSSSTSSASSNRDKKEPRPYSYAGHLDFDPRSPGYDQQRPDLPFVEAEVLPAGGTKAVAGVVASERNGKAEDSDDTETGATISSKVTSSSSAVTSSSVVTSSSTFVTSSTTTRETVTVSGEQKAGMVGAKLPTSVSAPTGFGAETASGAAQATLSATVSRTSVATTASRASVALEDSEDSAREATDNFPKYLGGKKKYRKKKGQKQQCKQQ
uniref:Ig-like domain-containing protein n=1 Tax=Branchiostoma floridae TaxID=7739 RepID=C3ZD19_BRAFL|eukprot:XP_002593519.1 hypothetical protein BRAFLDRAFT_125235 [Branchiostoma floridae]